MAYDLAGKLKNEIIQGWNYHTRLLFKPQNRLPLDEAPKDPQDKVEPNNEGALGHDSPGRMDTLLRLDTWQNENTALRTELAEERERVRVLSESHESLNNRFTEAMSQLEELRERESRAGAQGDAERSLLAILLSHTASMEARVKPVIEEYANVEASISTLRETFGKLSRRLKSSDHALAEAKSALAEQRNSVAATMEVFEAECRKNAALQQKIDELQGEASLREESVAALRHILETLRSDMKDMHDDFSKLSQIVEDQALLVQNLQKQAVGLPAGDPSGTERDASRGADDLAPCEDGAAALVVPPRHVVIEPQDVERPGAATVEEIFEEFLLVSGDEQ